MINPHAFELPPAQTVEKALILVFKSSDWYAENIFTHRLRKNGGRRHTPESFIRMIKLARDEYNRTVKIKQWNVTDDHIRQIVEQLVPNDKAKSSILSAFK